MLRHKATIQGARVAFGFSGITDEDEAAATPGLARDVTPPKVARVVPLDPFSALPTTQQAESAPAVVEAEYSQPATEEAPAPIEDDPVLLDLLDLIAEANTANALTSYAAQCAEIVNESSRAVAKRAIVNKAKELELFWDKKTSQYLPLA
jgi:hypothetical protein